MENQFLDWNNGIDWNGRIMGFLCTEGCTNSFAFYENVFLNNPRISTEKQRMATQNVDAAATPTSTAVESVNHSFSNTPFVNEEIIYHGNCEAVDKCC